MPSFNDDSLSSADKSMSSTPDAADRSSSSSASGGGAPDLRERVHVAVTEGELLAQQQTELDQILKQSQESVVALLARLNLFEDQVSRWKSEEMPLLFTSPGPTTAGSASAASRQPATAQSAAREKALGEENHELRESVDDYQRTLDHVTRKYRELLARVAEAGGERQRLLECALVTERSVNERLRAQNVTLKARVRKLLLEMRTHLNDDITDTDAELAIFELLRENDTLRKQLAEPSRSAAVPVVGKGTVSVAPAADVPPATPTPISTSSSTSTLSTATPESNSSSSAVQ